MSDKEILYLERIWRDIQDGKAHFTEHEIYEDD